MNAAAATLEIATRHGVAVIWLARPQVRNAFNETMIAELTAAFTTLGAEPAVRAIVLGGRGPAFCAGADLDWMRRVADYTEAQNRTDARALAVMLKTIDDCPKPTIARVHADAFAGGVGLVAACDIAIAATTASFCLSEVKLGLVPATIGPYVLRAIGRRAALRYAVTAEKFDAAEAFRIGLIHDLAPIDALDAKINEVLGALMLTSAEAVAATKDLLRAVDLRPIESALIDETAARIATARSSADGREGVRAFLEKRKPRWVVEFEALRAAGDEDEPM